MRNLVAVAALLLAGLAGFAQTVDPAEHVTLGASVIGFVGSAGGSVPASIVSANFNVTPSVAIGFEELTVPSIASYHLAVGAYTLPLARLAGKPFNSGFLNKVNVSFLAGGGILEQGRWACRGPRSIDRVAETVGAAATYPLFKHVTLQLLGYQYVHAGIVNDRRGASSTSAISSGVALSF